VSGTTTAAPIRGARRVRSDAQRNVDALLTAAKAAFATSGVDTPVRTIAERAGVGIGTVYRHFPQRSDLVAAVFRHELDSCAEAASSLAAGHEPGEALELWLQQYMSLLATKRGLVAALHSEAPAFEALPGCFQEPLLPALASLVEAAAAAGQVRGDVDPSDLLQAVACLCLPAADNPDHTHRMVALLIDGLRYGASSPANPTDG
jgi:AcrR family transcriptional regulator